ncbi:hypothetical protein Q4F19_19590 [Sphingomonas sp. BIUV-7]|uniref:CDP-Glycerol:Poly(Glycerophosphate) glycerophosphotransferase n=1 Tax=Sphingomonas natans TaxID=3063330 RepID=A0ABT8YDZ9_9SPHN|nr:hypothetical protein [Sphingomonas sp. BIUV-7]MDO6416596.1 hypothetical protein [Sphingomonas sp. BIUV-7]
MRSSASAGTTPGSVAFLFLGELFLIPHLLPIAIALAATPHAPRITLFVITSAHEEIIAAALAAAGLSLPIRRARGFRRLPAGSRETPHLPHKLGILARNAFAILAHDIAVCAERTSLWLPRIAQCFGADFVYNEHGAGPHANFSAPRNRAAARILMPGDGMADRVRESGHRDAPIVTVGYIKRDYMRTVAAIRPCPPFAERRPTVIYVPHWKRCKSSWWAMGEQILDHFAASDRYNLILAPHIRLPEFDPDFEARVAPYRDRPNIHIDATSFRLVDQTYIDAADIYLGCGSSQALEFAEHPRPIIFLNPDCVDWAADPRFSHWTMGDVADDIPELAAALDRADAVHPAYAPVQTAYVARMMGIDNGSAAARAAGVVLDALACHRARRWRAVQPLPPAEGAETAHERAPRAAA